MRKKSQVENEKKKITSRMIKKTIHLQKNGSISFTK